MPNRPALHRAAPAPSAALALALVLAVSLGACGKAGSDATPSPTPNEPPAGASSSPAATADGAVDAKVPGTDYHAIAMIACSVDGGKTQGTCAAGVKRNWGERGAALVEVTKPDGTKRALFFTGTRATGADSAEADGSAGWDWAAAHAGEETKIAFGPERYTVPDVLITGG